MAKDNIIYSSTSNTLYDCSFLADFWLGTFGKLLWTRACPKPKLDVSLERAVGMFLFVFWSVLASPPK